ncbi:DUF2239 family protein [Labrys monachus]|nr:DUF2239 family protein [Labrys monachus]
MNAALIAFAGTRRLARGEALAVALAVKDAQDAGEEAPILIFDCATGRPVDLDLRGTPDDIRARLEEEAPEPPQPRGPGRPRLGVVAREVTLLPRHWEWLSSQPGGASVMLRKLVDEARRTSEAQDRIREAREATYRFMVATAGNETDFEEASRALFAGEAGRFAMLVEPWPEDIREQVMELAEDAF